ncbi:hypothetical protein K438DRAFT_784905 [Mycena galopus ATCC 62051]|nr:hypothetical protein K438DRAFT_784905 [Mycena galopus ATCC 62051]
MTLEVAQKTLLEARQAAEEAQAALLSSRAAADAAEETKRLLEEPPPPRVPTPEPVNDNAELIEEMKKDLDSLRLWVDEQEARHLPIAAAHRDISQMREEEEASKMMMIAPDDTDTDGDAGDTNDTSAHDKPAPENQTDMEIDEPRRLEEDAARALVELAEQITTQDPKRLPTKDTMEKGKAEQVIAHSHAAHLPAAEDLPVNETALAREAALRKQQEARREQVRIQKEQAQAAAALSILKERQDAAAKSKSAEQSSSSPPLSNGDTQQQTGIAIAKATVLPPTQAKVKAKKSKPVSGGVKLGPELTQKVELSVLTDPSTSTDASTLSEPSPALERAAALGLRVRTNSTKVADTSASSSKPKKTRNSSLPATSHIDPESPQTDDISVYRTGSDPGDVHIILETPEMPPHLSTDVQLMNLRHALQDEGIPWEVISRSRPPLPGVKTEDVEDTGVKTEDVEDTGMSSLVSQPAPTPPQRPLVNPSIITPTPNVPVVTAMPAPLAVAPKPQPSRKQLPKFNKSKPPDGNTSNGQASTSVAAFGLVQSATPLLPATMAYYEAEECEAKPREAKAPPVTKPPPVVSAPAPPPASELTGGNNFSTNGRTLPRSREDSRSSNAGSGVSSPVPDRTWSRPLNERVSRSWGERSPPRRRFRSKTPDRDRYGGQGSHAYGGAEPERFGRATSPEPRDRSWAESPTYWSPPLPRSSSPLRSRARFPSPPQQRLESPKRTFSADRASYRPSAPAAFYSPRQDSPPKGPRHNVPRVPSQKRSREDEYTPQFHPQKRFKDDGRDASAASARSFDPEPDRLSLENRLGAPPNTWNAQYDNSWAAPRNEGLLSRLSDPGLGRGAPRGRGGPRARGNKMRGRGRGVQEVSLAERMY